MDLLLGYSVDENIPGWRESILKEFGQYLASTCRLFVVFSAELLMRMYHNNPFTVSSAQQFVENHFADQRSYSTQHRMDQMLWIIKKKKIIRNHMVYPQVLVFPLASFSMAPRHAPFL